MTEMIERRRHLGQLTGVAVADVEDEATDTSAGCLARQRREGRHRLEMRNGAALRRRFVEVVPCRDPIHRLVAPAPQSSQLVHGQVLLSEVYPQRDGHDFSTSVYLASTM